MENIECDFNKLYISFIFFCGGRIRNNCKMPKVKAEKKSRQHQEVKNQGLFELLGGSSRSDTGRRRRLPDGLLVLFPPRLLPILVYLPPYLPTVELVFNRNHSRSYQYLVYLTVVVANWIRTFWHDLPLLWPYSDGLVVVTLAVSLSW